jgi:hypothetical protein
MPNPPNPDFPGNQDTVNPPANYMDPSSIQLDQTLARTLIPVADNLRDLFTQFGLRPYRVKVVRVQWSDGARDQGTPIVVAENHLLPTPKMTGLDGVSEVLNPVGLDEQGSVVISQISGRYTEENLRGMDDDGTPIADNEEFFYEVEFISESGQPTFRRRFQLRGAPAYFAGKFEWQITLERTREDRARNGDPSF